MYALYYLLTNIYFSFFVSGKYLSCLSLSREQVGNVHSYLYDRGFHYYYIKMLEMAIDLSKGEPI